MLEHLSELTEPSFMSALANAVPQALVQQARVVKEGLMSQAQQSTDKASGKFAEPPVAAYGDVSAFHQVSLSNARPLRFGFRVFFVFFDDHGPFVPVCATFLWAALA